MDVVYVSGVGIRNPRLSSARKVLDRVRDLGSRRAAPAGPTDGPDDGVREHPLLVVPPRQLAPVRALNERLVERQLRAAIADWGSAVAWIRWPSPEVVDVLRELRPKAVVYECVDAYHLTPGITGAWEARHERAERALVELADVVVVPGEVLAERFRPWGAEVRVVPHGVEPFTWRHRDKGRTASVIGFIGTLDYRIDTAAFRAVATAHPEWRVRFVGPVQEGFDPAAYADLANISVEPPVPHAHLGATLAEMDLGLLAYVDSPLVRAMTPVKSLEFLAAGRPVVARRSPALERFAEVIDFAVDPDDFVRSVERALADDTAERATARREVAEANTWDRRTDELVHLVDELCA